jgi:DNA-directed RNA polymerase subunit RPC12/RpoP
MSEFKFSCPACSQNISCDTASVGTQIACPNCNATITVPKETAGTAQRTSGLAIASLVCSLSSFITCVGWLPGIICGHLAKSRLRRNPSLKGSGLATAGLVIGYLFLMSEVGTTAVYVWRVSNAVKHGFENARQNLATNKIIVVQTQSITVSNNSQPPEPAPAGVVVTNNQPVEPVTPPTAVATNQQIEPAKSEWTADISKVSFPHHPASGKLHGIDFAVKTASFRNGDLKIRAGNGTFVDIFHLDASIEGHSYEIQSDEVGTTNKPLVRMTWNEGDVIQTSTFSKRYGMKLQFDQAINRTVSAKIYLCFPDDSKSCVAGTFEVRLLKQN